MIILLSHSNGELCPRAQLQHTQFNVEEYTHITDILGIHKMGCGCCTIPLRITIPRQVCGKFIDSTSTVRWQTVFLNVIIAKP